MLIAHQAPPSLFISFTVRNTRQCGASALTSRAAARAASSCGRTRTGAELLGTVSTVRRLGGDPFEDFLKCTIMLP